MLLIQIIHQEDLGGTLFNPNEIFPTEGCAENYTGTWLNDHLGAGQLMSDSGALQQELAELIQGQGTFFVDARRKESISTGQALFEYEKDPDNDLEIKHLSFGSGECLVFSASGEIVTSTGVDCNSKHKPLCFSKPNILIDEICQFCPQNGPTRCLKWTNLDEYEEFVNGTENLFDEDEAYLTVANAKICTQPCGALTTGKSREKKAICEVR